MNKHAESENHRLSAKPYITGFILSLVCTVIPYLLVVNHLLTHSTLLIVILGFAFGQMAIQLFFFLHLGRGPKPLYNVGFFVGTFVALLVVVGGSIFIMAHLHENMAPSESALKLSQDEAIGQIDNKKTGACQVRKSSHIVTIKAGLTSPSHVDAHICDTLTLVRQDAPGRIITFGIYPAHGSYAGEDNLQLSLGHGKTITLSKAGTFQYYDVLHPETAGYFSVAP